jgi:hypothetical protein
MLDTEARDSCPAVDICTDGVLPFAAGDDIAAFPSARETLCQLVMLSLRFDRLIGVEADSIVSARRLDESCVDARSVDDCAGVTGCNCIWMAASVFRTNCERDMRVAKSATCKSVLSRSREYETA